MFGSPRARPGAPARSSSQLVPHLGVISRPVRAERAETEGDLVPAGALMRLA